MEKTFGSYDRVLMIGVDGMGSFNSLASTPNIDKLFENGAVTYTALSSRPTVSGPCWTSMLTGAIPEVHKLTNGNMHTIPELPTIITVVKNAFPNAETAAFSGWEPIAKSIISEESGASFLDTDNDDDALCEKVLDYLGCHDPKFLFIQFDKVDSAGHKHGYASQGHLESISKADANIGKIVSKYSEKGVLNTTLVIVTADHGGTIGGSHGDWSDGEKYVFLGVVGKNVHKSEIGEACLRDFPEIVYHALGIKSPEFNPNGYAAQLPTGIFRDAGVEKRQALYPEFKPFTTNKKEEPTKDSDGFIGNFIDMDKIKFWQNFENGVEDSSGNCSVNVEKGFVKTYNNGFIGKCGEYGCNTVRVEGVRHSEVFTFAFWCCNSGDSRWLELFSNPDGVHNSFSVAIYAESAALHIKYPDGFQPHYTEVFVNTLESPSTNVWTHFMFEVDTVNDEINCYVNFEKVRTRKSDVPLLSHFNMETLYLSFDQHMKQTFYKLVDDVMIIDGPAPVLQLKNYYI